MSDEKALATLDTNADLETLRAAVGGTGQNALTNSELKLALLYAEKVGADLFARQIYPVKMQGRLSFLTSIDFLRVIAQRSGAYRGQGRVDYGPDCDCAGEDLVLKRRHPEWAEVPVYREGFEEPVVRRAYFHEYAPIEGTWEGGRQTGWQYRETWRKMPHVMVAKVSEALAIRVAFPNDAQGLYTSDEMEQAEQLPAEAASRLSVGDIPPDAPAAEWATLEGIAIEAPDGVRQVQAPEWSGLKGKVTKLELKIKVRNRKHTAIVFNELAEAVAVLDLQSGERVALDGSVHEYEWAEGKPKAKQVRGITRLAVDRAGWIEAGVIDGEAVEVVEPAPEEPPAPSGGDLREQAADEFGDLVAEDEAATEIDADVDPGRGGNPNVGAGWSQLPVMDPEADESAASLEGYYAEGSMVVTAAGKELFDAWLTAIDMSSRIHVIMSRAWAEASKADRLGAGEQVFVRGVWKRVKDEAVILADVLKPAA